MYYSQQTIYISAYAKLPAGIPSESIYKVIDVGLVINTETGVIKDASFTLITDTASQFLKDLIIGFNVREEKAEKLFEIISSRYHGSAQKAVIVALKMIFEKFQMYEESQKRKDKGKGGSYE